MTAQAGLFFQSAGQEADRRWIDHRDQNADISGVPGHISEQIALPSASITAATDHLQQIGSMVLGVAVLAQRFSTASDVVSQVRRLASTQRPSQEAPEVTCCRSCVWLPLPHQLSLANETNPPGRPRNQLQQRDPECSGASCPAPHS